MKENLLKYLKYASGEVVLHVIGILLALNIDNYVAYRQDLAKEQKILKQLRGEFRHNRHNLTEKIAMRSDIIQSAHKVLYYIDNPESAIKDSLVRYIGHTLLVPGFEPIEDNLIVTGNIKLISNDTLRRMLINWPSETMTVIELELTWQEYVEDHYMPLTVKTGVIRDIIQNYWSRNDQIWRLDKSDTTHVTITKSKKKLAIVELLDNRNLEGGASIAISHNKGANIQSHALLDHIDEILGIIEAEIKPE